MAAAPPHFQAYPIPPAELGTRYAIQFLHPGYPEPTNTLLRLPRVDRAGENGVFGVHHGTALLACQIIAGNAFDTGRLTLDKEGQVPVTIPSDGILTEKKYYLVVGDRPDEYPVVPSFRDWEFPHDRIPDSWPQPPHSPATTSRCGITNFSFAIEQAYLIPKEEVLWYARNGIADSALGINNPKNLLPLKADIYKSFDERWFVICPKIPNAGSSPQFVTHLISDAAAELWPAYHNILVQHLPLGSLNNLFARFAWAILLQVKTFITLGLPRYIIQLSADNKDKVAYNIEYFTGSQLKNFYGGGGSKNATPFLKRKSGAGSVDDHDLASSSNMDWDLEGMIDDWDRTRRRNRESSDTVFDADIRPSLSPGVETKLKEAILKGMSQGEVGEEVEMD